MAHFEMYRDVNGQWRWRLQAGNNRIVATSGEGYVNKADCRAMIDWIKANSAGLGITEV